MRAFGRLVLVLAVAALAIAPRVVSAWGAQGHHIVARIAWSRLSPTARDRASALLGGGAEAFIAAATWADEVRPTRPETENWHFVDIPAPEAHYDAARDCRPTPHGDCIVEAIRRAQAELADATRPPEAAAESLKFLIHFVGDIHQPLHDIDNHDRGGNGVRVAALRGETGRATNLHSVWDTGLINLSDETEAARASRLQATLTTQPPDLTVDIVRWADEGHQLAQTVAYGYPGFSWAGPPADPITLDDAYRTKAERVIDQQLALGGARLAVLVNTLFGR